MKHNNSGGDVPFAKQEQTPDLRHTKGSAFGNADFRWSNHWWQVLLLLVLPLALYWQCIDYGYVLDDQIVITDNSFTKQGWSGLDDLLLTESFTGYFGEQKNLVQGNRYRPLSLMTFAVEYAITGGLTPWLSHLINILLYGLVGLLIYRVTVLILPKYKAPPQFVSLQLAIALLYIAHPIHTEAVANIKGRDEILAMLLSLSTLYYMWEHTVAGVGKAIYYASIAFFLALLAKENSVTFLAIIPLTLTVMAGRSWIQSLKAVWPLIVVLLVYVGLRIYAAGVPSFGTPIADLMNNPFVGMNFAERSATITYTLLKYLQLFVWPHPLSHDYYPYAIPKLSWLSWQAVVAALTHVVLLWYALRSLRRHSIASYGLAFYFIALTIVSNIVINVGTFMNERFMFMASLGLTIATTYMLYSKLGQWRGRIGRYASVLSVSLLLVAYSLLTTDRVPDWQSALALNRSAVAGGSNSARANSFMATALYNEVKTLPPSENANKILIEAYTYANKAVSIHPKYANANLMLAGISAELYKQHRDEGKLLSDLEKVARQRPDVSYLTEYLDYFDGVVKDEEGLRNWYKRVGLHILTDSTIHPSWSAHYLLRAYKLYSNDQEVLAGLVQAYSRAGDKENAQRFSIKLNSSQQ